jgi:hypothetical protein
MQRGEGSKTGLAEEEMDRLTIKGSVNITGDYVCMSFLK